MRRGAPIRRKPTGKAWKDRGDCEPESCRKVLGLARNPVGEENAAGTRGSAAALADGDRRMSARTPETIPNRPDLEPLILHSLPAGPNRLPCHCGRAPAFSARLIGGRVQKGRYSRPTRIFRFMTPGRCRNFLARRRWPFRVFGSMFCDLRRNRAADGVGRQSTRWMAYSVSQRTQEIGRGAVALGATRGSHPMADAGSRHPADCGGFWPSGVAAAFALTRRAEHAAGGRSPPPIR